MDLLEKTCTPCRGGIAPFTKPEAESHMAAIPEWQLNAEGTIISRRFCFNNFSSALHFAVKTGECAEKEGHHPTLTIGWGYCTVSFSTSKIKGLHENDFIMAAKINDLAG